MRLLYREAFTAKPTHALFLTANDAPKTDAYDDALKDRVIARPFTHPLREGGALGFEGHARVETARLDPNSALLRGFAAWLADGLERLYQSQEIYRAPAVQAATAKFWADADPLTPFWETVEEDSCAGASPKASCGAATKPGAKPKALDGPALVTSGRAPVNHAGWKVNGEAMKSLPRFGFCSRFRHQRHELSWTLSIVMRKWPRLATFDKFHAQIVFRCRGLIPTSKNSKR